MADAIRSSLETLKSEGARAFERGKYAAAAAVYSEALALVAPPVPGDLVSIVSTLYMNRSMCWKLDGGRDSEMEADARSAAALDRLNAKAHYLIGVAHTKRSEWLPAVRALETGLEMARRQKRAAGFLRELEIAIATARARWHEASAAEDAEGDAILYSALQSALDNTRDARLARAVAVAAGGSSDSDDSADAAIGAATPLRLASAPRRGVRPASAAPAVLSSHASARCGSSASTLRPASARPSLSSTADAALGVGAGLRRGSVRYDASILADAELLRGGGHGDSGLTHGSAAMSAAPASDSSDGQGSASFALPQTQSPEAEHAVLSARLGELFQERERVRMARDIPQSFICPITFDVFIAPVVAPSGHTYDRAAIERYLRSKAEDPITRGPLAPHQLIPNHALAASIHDWLQLHPWAHPLLPPELHA